MKKQLIILLITLILINTTTAIEGNMALLTVAETDNDTIGGIANLHLEIKPGTGRVFIDTFPYTKTDTQISTRYAKKVACDFLDEDCTNKDFFYTIKAKSNIVGGPSASGAMTVLTIALLEGIQPKQDIVMTGTINSGGIIGPVAGIKEKTEAAKNNGFKKALIPKRSILKTNVTNNTAKNSSIINRSVNITYVDDFKVQGIEIVKINTLPQALKEFLGKEYPQNDEEITIPEDYQKIMGKISEKLCKRYEDILKEIPDKLRKENEQLINATNTTIENAVNASAKNDYYSAASFCFTANRDVRTLQMQNLTNQSKRLIIADLRNRAAYLDNTTKQRPLRTISELETYMIVKDRLDEVKEILQKNESQIFNELGYASERFYSAIAWSSFYEYESPKVKIDNQYLEEACLSKIAEVEERKSYLEIMYSTNNQQDEDISKLKTMHKQEEYAYCLYKASKLKADINAIISTFSITNEKIDDLVEDKLRIARQQINKQETFPVLGYSYYNYATSLRETDPTLSLIFSEYALELGNLKMYFPKETQAQFNMPTLAAWQYLIIGIIIGIMIANLIKLQKQDKPKK